MRFASFVWWQGESNSWTVENAREYACNQDALIGDLRSKFSAPTLPFLYVQSFPLFGDLSRFQPFPAEGVGVLHGLPELRLAQAQSSRLPRVAMACAIDLGDVSSPFTWQHNRAKQQCASRLAAAARGVVYGDASAVWRGPEPRGVRPIEPRERAAGWPYAEVEVAFSMFGSRGFDRAEAPLSTLVFEALVRGPLARGADGRSGTGADAEFWIPMSLLPRQRTDSADSIGLGVTAWFAGHNQTTVVALRYAYADFPVGVLHTVEGLPLPPFRLNCTIEIPASASPE